MIAYAIQVAERNTDYPKWPIGAVLAKGGSVLAVGWSKLRNQPINVPNGENCSEHAEVAVLRKARRCNLKGSVIYVARIGADGNPRLAKPCPSCEENLREAGIKKIVYTYAKGEVVIVKL